MTKAKFEPQQTILIADDTYLHNDDTTVDIEDISYESKEIELQWLRWTFHLRVLQLSYNWNNQIAQFEKQVQSYLLSNLTSTDDIVQQTKSSVAAISPLGTEVATFIPVLNEHFEETGQQPISQGNITALVGKSKKTNNYEPLDTSKIDGLQIVGILCFATTLIIMAALLLSSTHERNKRLSQQKQWTQINLLELNDAGGTGIQHFLPSPTKFSSSQMLLKKMKPMNVNYNGDEDASIPLTSQDQKYKMEMMNNEDENDTSVDSEEISQESLIIVNAKRSGSNDTPDRNTLPCWQSPLQSMMDQQSSIPSDELMDLKVMNSNSPTKTKISKKKEYLKRKLTFNKKEKKANDDIKYDLMDEDQSYTEEIFISPKSQNHCDDNFDIVMSIKNSYKL